MWSSLLFLCLYSKGDLLILLVLLKRFILKPSLCNLSRKCHLQIDFQKTEWIQAPACGFVKEDYCSFMLHSSQIHVTGAALYNLWDLC